MEKAEKDLTEYDNQINEFTFKVEAGAPDGVANAEATLDRELAVCEDYKDKIIESLNRLQPRLTRANGALSSALTDAQRSMLRSPQAPLPVFHSKPGEEFELFVQNFEDTVSKFNYAAYDKFLLLKQQIKGRAL